MSQSPIIFFPGTLCDERIWLPTWQRMEIEQRSFVPLQWAENLEQMLALSEDRLAMFDGKVNLVGYSMGGYIAALTALKNTDKIKSLTLVSFDTFGLPVNEQKQRKSLLSLPKNKLQGLTKQAAEKFVSTQCKKFDEIYTSVKEMEQDLGLPQLCHHYRATSERQNLTKQLANASFPINCIAGEEDHLASVEQLTRMANVITFKHQHTEKQAAHLLPLEKPDVLAQFLKQIL